MLNEYSHLMPFSKKQPICKNVDSATMQWGDDDGTLTRYRCRDRVSLNCQSTIASSSSCHRTITIASSSSHLRAIVISHHCVIVLSTQTRWCDCTILNCVAISGFHIFWLRMLPWPDLEDWLTVGVTGQQGILIPPWHLVPPLVYPGVHVCHALMFAYFYLRDWLQFVIFLPFHSYSPYIRAIKTNPLYYDNVFFLQ